MSEARSSETTVAHVKMLAVTAIDCNWQQVVVNAKTVLALVECAERSLELRDRGFRNNGIDLIVRERKDNSDPHFKWCTALEKLDAL